MAAGDLRIGLNGKFYYGAAGSTPSTETSNVEDVTLRCSQRMAERIKRGKKIVTKKGTVGEVTLTFKVFDEESDAFLAQLETSYWAQTPLAFYAKSAASGTGVDMDAYISGFEQSQPNAEFISYSITAEPTEEQRDVSYH